MTRHKTSERIKIVPTTMPTAIPALLPADSPEESVPRGSGVVVDAEAEVGLAVEGDCDFVLGRSVADEEVAAAVML
jgi:hypothetical protein